MNFTFLSADLRHLLTLVEKMCGKVAWDADICLFVIR